MAVTSFQTMRLFMFTMRVCICLLMFLLFFWCQNSLVLLSATSRSLLNVGDKTCACNLDILKPDPVRRLPDHCCRHSAARRLGQVATGHGVITEKRRGGKQWTFFYTFHCVFYLCNYACAKKESWLLLFSCAMSCQIRLHWFASMRKVSLFCKICFANSFGDDKNIICLFSHGTGGGGETDQDTTSIPPIIDNGEWWFLKRGTRAASAGLWRCSQRPRTHNFLRFPVT